jgi:glutamate formiminotransferase/formiminotetrahydrofolate cyclodeaminase
MNQIIECIPNISEGRDSTIIDELLREIESVIGVRILNVDIGYSANRTVITFAGNPAAVIEAAFLLIKKAYDIIDMRNHQGIHPRIGAVDVCPFVPISGISMDETVKIAATLGQKVGNDLQLPVFLYGYSARDEIRYRLENIRKGEYEGLQKKFSDPVWMPDYGPAEFIPRFGAIAIGARNFLIAYNINLGTKDTLVAKEIAVEIRESGGEVKRTKNNVTISERISGKLKAVKAIGWFEQKYHCAQVSVNLLDYHTTSIFEVFRAVVDSAKSKNVEVTGSEIIGMVPLNSIVSEDFQKADIHDVLNNPRFIDLLNSARKSLQLLHQDGYVLREKILEFAMLDLF